MLPGLNFRLTGVAEPDGEPGDGADDDARLRHDDEGGHERQEGAEQEDEAQLPTARPWDKTQRSHKDAKTVAQRCQKCPNIGPTPARLVSLNGGRPNVKSQHF